MHIKKKKGDEEGEREEREEGKEGKEGKGPQLCLMKVWWFLSLKDLGSLTFSGFGFTSFRRNGT